MAIHDFGLRGYDGARTGGATRMLAIATSDVARTFRSKKFVVFYAFCLLPALAAFGLLYFQFIVIEGRVEFADFQWPPGLRAAFDRLHTPDFFLNFGKGATTLLTILFGAVAGASIIARDRHAGALELYFTRGLRPWQYVAGKWLAVWFLMVCQVLWPFLAVWLFGVAVASEESGYFARTSEFIGGVALGQTFLCATLALWLVALSSSTDSPRFAMLRWIGAMFVLQVAGRILFHRLGEPDWQALSPWKTVQTVAASLAGGDAVPAFDPTLAWIVWGALTVTALVWLARHMRPIEVVG